MCLPRWPAPRPSAFVGDMRAGLTELGRRVPDAKLGIIGFCFGGGMVWTLLDAGEPRLAAAIPFYGPAPSAPDFSGNTAAVLGVYAELDARVNASLGTATAALEAAGLTHEMKTYPGVDHAFFNDTGGRYDATQAEAAYADVLAWLGRYLAAWLDAPGDLVEAAGRDIEREAVDRHGLEPGMRLQALDRHPDGRLEVVERPEAHVNGLARRSSQPLAQGVLVGVEESASGMADDDDPVGAEQLLADDQRPNGVLGG